MFRSFIFLLMLISFSPVWALSSDRQQPIAIEADQVDIDERAGISTYRGNVRLTQGSLRMQAEQVVVHSRERAVQKVIATGQPATFSQRPDNADEDVQASAEEVEYDAVKGTLLLQHQATFTQGMNLFQGNRIEYDMQNDTVAASSKEDSPSRVQVIIHPGTLEK